MTRNVDFSKLNWTPSIISWLNTWMNIPNHRHELPHEAEPDRDIIEALVARFESQIEELKQQVQSLSEQDQSLTERLQKPGPGNSSLPPSSEHPQGKPPRKPSKQRIRKQEGQEGHKRDLRELVPIEQCEAVISCVPESSRRSGGLVRPDESQPIGHQVLEIPPIQPTVIEYQLQRVHSFM
jgi:transposase